MFATDLYKGVKNQTMIRKIEYSESSYPSKLFQIQNPPQSIYYRGNVTILNDNVIAVIGQREASDRSMAIAYQVGKILAQNGYTILNGLAIGCDKYAAMGALSQNGKMVGVMPCGLDHTYPASCKQIAEEIVEKGGCLISQYQEGIRPEKYRFIERDLLQAVLSLKIIVISAKTTGGTMHTVSYAVKAGRQIGCVIEHNELSDEGNIYICKKYNAKEIKDNTSLLEFVSENNFNYEQLSFLNNNKI